MRSLIYTLILFMAVSACAVEPTTAPSATEASGGDSAVGNIVPESMTSDDTPAAEALSASSALELIPATSGCSHVVFCDAPGSTGTVCQQDGCTLQAAKAECLSDLAAIGCSFHCPGHIQTLAGGNSPMCCPNVCSSGCPC